MAYMVSTGLNLHWVKLIEARAGSEGVLTLTFRGDPSATELQFNMAEVTVFLDDQKLVDALVLAINAVNRNHQPVEADPTFTPRYPTMESDDEPLPF